MTKMECEAKVKELEQYIEDCKYVISEYERLIEWWKKESEM